MRKKSETDPLRIAAVTAGPGIGRVGITFCPGKYDPHASSGFWDRDLNLDLDAIREWGAAAVVTLLQPWEFSILRVDRLGEEVGRRGMSWFHLPIADGSTPDRSFEQEWKTVGAELHSMLLGGSDVLVHCRGGLGRAGTIAARLLIELGMEPRVAIERLRVARPGAIETPEQMKYVLNLRAIAK